jgi:hypothetical protein
VRVVIDRVSKTYADRRGETVVKAPIADTSVVDESPLREALK